MKKNLYLIFTVLATINSNIFAMGPADLTIRSLDGIKCATSSDRCLEDIYKNIISYTPERLLELIHSLGDLNFTEKFHHDDLVNSAVFSPDGSYVLTASDGGEVKPSVVFSPDGTSILVCNKNKAILYQLPLFSLKEFAVFLLVSRHNQFIQSNAQIKQFVIGLINGNEKLKKYCTQYIHE
jgi:hypothetical protein